MITEALRKIGRRLIDFNIRLNKIAYSPKMNAKFLEWANNNGFRIEKLEVSSVWEAGFYLVQRSGACVKVILIDGQNNRRGAYLQTGTGFSPDSMQTKFVEAGKIRFDDPVPVEELTAVDPGN